MSHPLFILRKTEMVLTAIRAQGAGGQNINKVSNAVHLRFDVHASSLPDDIKARLLTLSDQRITERGVVVIKAQSSRSLESNRTEAIGRLRELVQSVAFSPKSRKATQPSYGSQQKRLQRKASRGQVKRLRGPVGAE
jgi:ribosome-associated protein